MTASALFGLTPADLLAKLVPVSGSHVFSIGSAGPPTNDLSDASALAIIAEQEAMVESYLRHKYQRLLRRVEGEVAVSRATAGQTTCKASLTPVTTCRVFVNYPTTRSWPDRRPDEALRADEFSIDLASGVITLVKPLDLDDRVYLDYEHTGASKLLDLRHLVLNLAAVEVARRFAYFRSAEGFDRFEGWQSSAAGHLRDLTKTDGVGIPLFDRLDLVNETRNLSLGRL